MNPVVLLTLMGFLGGGSPGPDGGRLLYSFEDRADLRAVTPNNAHIALTNSHATEGANALKVDYQPAEWPNITFNAKENWDWTAASGLAIDISNPGSETVSFGIRVDDDRAADGIVHCRTGSGSLGPGKSAVFVMRFGPDPMAVGMRGLPASSGTISLGAQGSGVFGLGHIVAFQIFMHRPKMPTTLIVDNIRLVPGLSLNKIVDAYGQYTGAEWPGKVHTDAELKSRAEQEEADIKTHPALPGRDKYGGWADGPKLKATGFFRAEKRNGKWWLVTPEGHLFFSVGVDTVNLETATFTAGREAMFTWLPEAGDPLAKHRGYTKNIHSGPVNEGATFDFYRANLERKFGADWKAKWHENVLKRLPSWGFNTLGNWSDEAFYGNGRVPYVATTGVGGNHARVSSGSDYWSKMHDPFDSHFAADARDAVRSIAAKVKEDPWCLGWFVDNELSWAGDGVNGRYGLALGALNSGMESPAKRALIAQLKQDYSDIGKLNAAWNTAFTDWRALEAPFKPHGTLPEGMKPALSKYVMNFAREYFRVVRDAVQDADPNHLYMGCRFAWYSEEAVKAASELCDVVSFNVYAPHLDDSKWGTMKALNKPCIIGEFHFGALDRGMFHPGLVSAPDQHARAMLYRDYVRSVVDNPAFVGCHWFQYTDEPLTGRTWDGENYNIGLVNVTDTPYPEMMEAARQVHSEMYTRRER